MTANKKLCSSISNKKTRKIFWTESKCYKKKEFWKNAITEGFKQNPSLWKSEGLEKTFYATQTFRKRNRKRVTMSAYNGLVSLPFCGLNLRSLFVWPPSASTDDSIYNRILKGHIWPWYKQSTNMFCMVHALSELSVWFMTPSHHEVLLVHGGGWHRQRKDASARPSVEN